MVEQLIGGSSGAPASAPASAAAPAAPPAPPAPGRTLRLVQAWLVALGAAAVVVGGHDMAAGREVIVRIWATLVLGGGCVLVAGGLALPRGTARGRALAMVAALLGAALGAMLLLAQAANDEPDRRLLAWAVVTGASVACAVYVRRISPAEERGGRILTVLPVLKSVVSVGVLISVAQFWYASIYVPTTRPASLTVEADLRREPASGGRVALVGTVRLRNTSGTIVTVLASTMRVRAARIVPVGEAAEADTGRSGPFDALLTGVFRRNTPGEFVTRGFAAPVGEVVAAGHVLPVTTYFDPDETITRPIVAWVPEGRHDVATLDVGVAVARGRALDLAYGKSAADRVEGGAIVETPIVEAGWLRRLTRSERSLRAAYPSDGGMPGIEFVAPDGDGDEAFDERLQRFYGVNVAFGTARLPLAPAS